MHKRLADFADSAPDDALCCDMKIEGNMLVVRLVYKSERAARFALEEIEAGETLTIQGGSDSASRA